jgi:copper resistance protein C
MKRRRAAEPAGPGPFMPYYPGGFFMRRFLFMTSAAIAFVVASHAVAEAHAHLMSAIPANGAVVPAAPHALRLRFTEGVEPAFSGVTLSSARGPVATGPLAVDPSNPTHVVVPIVGSLAPGTYTVAWHAVAIDTHRTQGSYTFRIRGR